MFMFYRFIDYLKTENQKKQTELFGLFGVVWFDFLYGLQNNKPK